MPRFGSLPRLNHAPPTHIHTPVEEKPPLRTSKATGSLQTVLLARKVWPHFPFLYLEMGLKVNPPQCYQPGAGLRQAPERVTADQSWGGQVPPGSPPPNPFGLPLTPSCNDFVVHVRPLQSRVQTQGGHAWDRAHGS